MLISGGEKCSDNLEKCFSDLLTIDLEFVASKLLEHLLKNKVEVLVSL